MAQIALTVINVHYGKSGTGDFFLYAQTFCQPFTKNRFAGAQPAFKRDDVAASDVFCEVFGKIFGFRFAAACKF